MLTCIGRTEIKALVENRTLKIQQYWARKVGKCIRNLKTRLYRLASPLLCCCCLVPKSCPTLCNHMDCSIPGSPVLHYFPELSQTHDHWVDNATQPSLSLLSPCLQSFLASESFPMSLLFTSGGQSIGASVSVLPVNIQGWFPLWIDWFDLLAVQEILKSLLQHHNSSNSLWVAFYPSLAAWHALTCKRRSYLQKQLSGELNRTISINICLLERSVSCWFLLLMSLT